MPASQHQKPLSDIAIAQAAKKRPIMDMSILMAERICRTGVLKWSSTLADSTL